MWQSSPTLSPHIVCRHSGFRPQLQAATLNEYSCTQAGASLVPRLAAAEQKGGAAQARMQEDLLDELGFELHRPRP